jgi:predicted DNA-binding protein (UPF0251 family)
MGKRASSDGEDMGPKYSAGLTTETINEMIRLLDTHLFSQTEHAKKLELDQVTIDKS